jgi:hypothetical protein
MTTVQFNCVVSSTDFSVPLGMEIWLDDHRLFDTDHVDQIYTIQHDISDDDGDHELRFVLKNKLLEHTQVDADGNIIRDNTLSVSGIEFDGIDCQYLVTTVARYQHDFNGTGDATTQRFYGEMGCNGTVSVKFSTPIYIWLLENM